MTDLAVALALILIIEGSLYALFPNSMRKILLQVVGLPQDQVRNLGLGCAILGVVLVWLIRG